MTAVFLWIIDVLVVLGAVVLTIGVIGLYRLPETLNGLHASSLAFILGTIPILVAIFFSGKPDLIDRAILIAIFLILTSPVASHAIAVVTNQQDQSDEETR